jgi:putative Holliday junction resolvase
MSDERLTTVEADGLLDEMGIAPADRKTYLDTVAANIILQEYMENHREEMTRLLRENTWRAEE